ncbi:UNKNOWN [Stylonychia lemnae]|uniref:Uncharacterized protein n=1 Tax=Stylonychia lemnae TaxID=5949 RepID=A0A077ZV17_STYLE|nr:UNKNOWN [Stylonychia lemnae]|eukprot:CDW73439.1 UNKNOWN [Stylonychia lemnae]
MLFFKQKAFKVKLSRVAGRQMNQQYNAGGTEVVYVENVNHYRNDNLVIIDGGYGAGCGGGIMNVGGGCGGGGFVDIGCGGGGCGGGGCGGGGCGGGGCGGGGCGGGGCGG